MDGRVKIELSAEEQNPNSEVSECTKTASSMFQALDFGVKTFGQAVGDGVSEIGQEIFEMDFEHSGDVFNRSQPTADRPAVPAIKGGSFRVAS